MHINDDKIRAVAGHVEGGLQMVQVLLTRHDLGPNARSILLRAEDALLSARKTTAEWVREIPTAVAHVDLISGDTMITTTPVEEKFGNFA
jgi:hypothetical protein